MVTGFYRVLLGFSIQQPPLLGNLQLTSVRGRVFVVAWMDIHSRLERAGTLAALG